MTIDGATTINDLLIPNVIDFLDFPKVKESILEEENLEIEEKSSDFEVSVLPDMTSNHNNTYSGSVVYGVLNRGFATTIGNAIRRVLLSSIKGLSIIAFSVEGVSHEFDRIEGVLEDISQIALNFKKVRFKRPHSKSQSSDLENIGFEAENFCFSFEFSGPGVIKASALEEHLKKIVVNGDLVLFNITSQRKINFRIYVGFGYGYCPASLIRSSLERFDKAGVIFLDALFSPIVSVSFSTEEIIHNNLVCENLLLSIVTDGSISYREAIVEASRILTRQVAYLDPGFNHTILKPETSSKEEGNFITSKNKRPYLISYFRKIADLRLPIRAANAFARAGIMYLGDLLVFSSKQLNKMPNLGRKSIDSVQKIISKHGCAFDSSDQSPWPPPDLADLVKKCEEKFEDEKIW